MDVNLKTLRIICIFVLIIFAPIFTAATEPTKKILILSSEDIYLPSITLVDKAIRETLKTGSSDRFLFYTEALDNLRISNDKYEAEMVNLLRRKYEGEKIDLIFALAPPSMRLLSKYEDQLFVGVPKIFVTSQRIELTGITLSPNVTAITGKIEFGPTIDLMLSQHPATKRILVISGHSRLDKIILERAQKEFAPFGNRVEFLYPASPNIQEWQKELSTLPPNSLVFYLSFLSDNAGNTFNAPESLSLLVPSSKAPVYGFAQTLFGYGIVGGSLINYELIGQGAAKIGQRILAGESPQNIPPETAPNVVMFDWRELQKWRINENSLPPGSIVEFKVPTLWEQYRWYIAGFIALLIAQSLLIGWLLFIQSRRRQAEKESIRFAALARDEHRRLNDVVSNVPGIVWESWSEPGSDSRTTRYISDYAEKMLGYSVKEWLSTPDFLFTITLDEHRERVRKEMQEIFEGGKEGIIQFPLVAKEGRVFWTEAHLVTICDEKGTPVGLRGVTMDITERKNAEERLHSRELELTEAQRVSKIGSWEWDAQSETVTWTEELYRIAGLATSQPAPNFEQHAKLYTPESFEKLAAAMAVALDSGAPYELELEMIRSDNQKVWTNVRGEAIRDKNSRIVKLRGTLQDISYQKKVEQELRNVLKEVNQLQKQLREENVYLKEVIKLEHNFEEIIGHSESLKYVLFKIEQVAPTDATVLITGETGTGKELVARAIHKASLRKTRPLVKVNCAALSANLIESELFGHERGSFTGASARKIGRFELANGATIFLDEVGELPMELQVKLLRVIQEGEFERLGSSKTIKADVRIIAATNRNLKAEVQNGSFREDLLFRLNVFPITVPPLRERKDDISALIEHFVSRFSKKVGKTITSVPPAMMRDLCEYAYPGNIRELANIIERSVINTPGDTLRVSEIFETAKAENGFSVSRETLEVVERNYINKILEDTNWKIEGANGAAGVLGLNPSTLRTRMTKLGISKKQSQKNNA